MVRAGFHLYANYLSILDCIVICEDASIWNIGSYSYPVKEFIKL